MYGAPPRIGLEWWLHTLNPLISAYNKATCIDPLAFPLIQINHQEEKKTYARQNPRHIKHLDARQRQLLLQFLFILGCYRVRCARETSTPESPSIYAAMVVEWLLTRDNRGSSE